MSSVPPPSTPDRGSSGAGERVRRAVGAAAIRVGGRGRLALAAVAVVAALSVLIAGAAVLIVRPSAGPAGNGLVDLDSTPSLSAWSVPGFRLENGIQLLGRVGRDRSVFFAPAADGVSDGRLLLLDARSRSIVWSVSAPPPQEEGSPLQLVTTDPIVVNTVDGVIAFAPATGKVLSRTGGAATVIGGDATGARPDLDGDVLLQQGSTLERVAGAALTDRRWSVSTAATGFVLAGDVIVSGSTAYSASTGKTVPWAGRSADEDQVVGGHVLARRGAPGDAVVTWALLDDAGKTIRTFTSDGGDAVGWNSQVYVVRQGSMARAYDLTTGESRWTVPAVASTNPAMIVLPRSSGVIPLLTVSGSSQVQIADAASGRALYRLRTASTVAAGPSSQVVGVGSRTLYLQDGSTLRALGLRDGTTRWERALPRGAAVLPIGDTPAVFGDIAHPIASLTD